MVESRCEQRLAAYAFPEEQTARFEGGANEGGADATVETEESIGAERLAEAVEGPSVAEWNVIGL